MLTSSRQRGTPQILQQHPVARDSFLGGILQMRSGTALNNMQVNKPQITMMQGSAPSTSTFRDSVSPPVQLGRKKCGFGELGEVQLLLRRKQPVNGL